MQADLIRSSPDGVDEQKAAEIVLGLDGWFETMRTHSGYGGPVVHWWQNSLQYTGAGLDWRYEGIIIGYVTLYQKTGDPGWLSKARQAGDDLVQGQLAIGNYRNSKFELNPYSGGTPHEAAADLGLLHLAQAMKQAGDPGWEVYFETAQKNITAYYVETLWNEEKGYFEDSPGVPTFVPNKAATLVEALLKLSEMIHDETLADKYAHRTLDTILAHQIQEGDLHGAICQNSFQDRLIHKYFPYYVARCVPGLISGYERFNDQRYLDAALDAMGFVMRYRFEDGSFPQVVYPGGRMNRFPQWRAAVGDILRGVKLLWPYGFEADPSPTVDWFLRGYNPAGSFATAHGFNATFSQRDPGPLPDFRDLLPVCGWNDKAWRFVTELLPGDINLDDRSRPKNLVFETECVFRGRICQYYEDGDIIELKKGDEVYYRWRKGVDWAEVCVPEICFR